MNIFARMFRRPEPVVVEKIVPVVGEPHFLTIYEVSVPDEDSAVIETWAGTKFYTRHKSIYFQTCEQAHAANGGSVEAHRAVRIEDKVFRIDGLRAVDVLPKPKVAKGRK